MITVLNESIYMKNNIKVLSVNSGSSTLKVKLFEMPCERVLFEGTIEKIGFETANFLFCYKNKKIKKQILIDNYESAAKFILNFMESKIVSSLSEIKMVGHRIAHGGDYYKTGVIVTEEVTNNVMMLSELAPLHNKIQLSVYKIFKKIIVNSIHVFIFDTAFHQSIVPEKFLYPIPYYYYKKYKIKKYGAHGISHKYVSKVATKLIEHDTESKIISCHLGNGSSISAIKNGISINNSMGFTPLAGVMMGTRTGDIDPSIIFYLHKKLKKSIEEIELICNKSSGLLGISNISSDCRDIMNFYSKGDEQAILAISMYVNTIVKYISFYNVELEGCNLIIFTGGIGENSHIIRKLIIEKLQPIFEVELDDKLNMEENKNNYRLISSNKSKIKIYVIHTDEELEIARQTFMLFKSIKKQ